MDNSLKFRFTLVLFYLVSVLAYCESTINFQLQDSLSNKTYEELIIGFSNSINDSLKAKIYARTYLNKAKKENSQFEIAQGYHFFIYLNSGEKNVLKYCDSLLKLTKKNKHTRYPTLAYLEKGNYYFQVKNFRSALDNYILANDYVTFYTGELKLKSLIDYNIGLIKGRLGRNKEALEIFKSNWEETKNDKKNVEDRLEAIYSLSDSYMKNRKFDSSSYYNNLGVKESILNQKYFLQNQFILNEGIVKYKQGLYNTSLDSLNKVLLFFEKNKHDNELIETYYYLGKVHKTLNQVFKSILYFKKVDSIFLKSNDIIPEARESYEILINHYKSINDQNNQLFYIERLLKADSLLNTNYKYLNDKIIYKYDTPKLIIAKEKIIGNLNQEKKISHFGIALLILIIIISYSFFLTYRRKQKRYTLRFKNLIAEREILQKKNSKENGFKKTPKEIGISVEIIEDILLKLQSFEDNQEYLSNDISIQNLSKSFNTNARYLSKIINTYKKTNFSNYLNDLRIDFCIKKLTESKKHRNYTIKAIALELGFNNTQSFSNAFHKKTGIYPSYFIQQLSDNNV